MDLDWHDNLAFRRDIIVAATIDATAIVAAPQVIPLNQAARRRDKDIYDYAMNALKIPTQPRALVVVAGRAFSLAPAATQRMIFLTSACEYAGSKPRMPQL